MLLRLLGMLLVVAVPSVSSAQLFARGRTATRFTSRTVAKPCCQGSCVTPVSYVEPTVVQPLNYVVPATPVTVVQPTTCVQPASCVQPACAPCARTIERTRTRVISGGCATGCSPCTSPAVGMPATVIYEGEGGATPGIPTPADPVSAIPSIPSEVVTQPIGQFVPSMSPIVQTASYVQPTGFVQSASYTQRQTYVGRRSGGMGSAQDALAIVNQRRAARGLYPLNFDPTLASTAQYKSQARANRRMTGHDGSQKAGARAEGVGYAFGGGDLSGRFKTCHLYSTGYRSAGAAIAYDSRGAAYYTLLLR